MKNTILEAKIKEMRNDTNKENKDEKQAYVSTVNGKTYYGNHAQRREMKKRDVKNRKIIAKYIKNHPEAVNIELDEDVINSLEAKKGEGLGETLSNNAVCVNETESLAE